MFVGERLDVRRCSLMVKISPFKVEIRFESDVATICGNLEYNLIKTKIKNYYITIMIKKFKDFLYEGRFNDVDEIIEIDDE